MKRAFFIAVTVSIPVLFLVVAAAIALPMIDSGVRPLLLQYMASRLTDRERDEIHRRIAEGAAFWDTVPDPELAAIGLRGRTILHAGTDVRINNAGMRAARDYAAKPEGTFRIVCLGDSFVFGMGGPEQDRFCDQLAAYYREHGIRAGGRTIEALAVGLPGWTLVQEATYLASRLTDYDPDLIIVLSVANDITDNFGVTGGGAATRGFSPEARALGSAVFSNELNATFGDAGERSALAWDLSPKSRSRWDKAMQRLKRLVEIQQERGKHVLVSAMAWGATEDPDPYPLLFQAQLARQKVPAPFVRTSFLPGRRTTLAHDNHPNRLGHALLRDQYVHALHRLGWVTVPQSVLPALDRRTPVLLDGPADPARLDAFTRRYLARMQERIDFSALRPAQTRAFLGGLFPDSGDPSRALESAPWGSLQTAFLLRRPQGRALKGVDVEIDVPPRPELFPFSLRLLLDGAASATEVFVRPNETGRYRISGAPAAPAFNDQVVEVTLETDSYFSTIEDARMKSYRTVRARAF
jgi:lysophospholipase L1-like esterase